MKSPGCTCRVRERPSFLIRCSVLVMYFEPGSASPILIQLTRLLDPFVAVDYLRSGAVSSVRDEAHTVRNADYAFNE